MLDTDSQLARLKQRIAAIDLRFAQRWFAQGATATAPMPIPAASKFSPDEPTRSYIEHWADGEVVQNQFGEHFQTERLFAAHKQHGAADIGTLAELPSSLMDALGCGEVPATPCERWAFLDTETTGLSGGS